ncbi:MAG TPA: hypothetical protein VE133_18115 [Candidatus Sulfotelmatobacter sp.]|nr:hypothetical protein [Candidatus Sulfotelmatobacter sp.]
MKSVFLCAFALFSLAMPVYGQSQPEIQKGFNGFEAFQGSLNSDSRMFKLDSNVGYEFNKHVGVFAGLPLYFANTQTVTTQVNGTATTTTTQDVTNNGLGNAYFGFALRAPNKTLDYSSTVTFAAPTGSTSKGFSSGRANADWTNRFEHSFNRLTPYFEGGLSNAVPDSQLFTRPFTSLGTLTHFEEGGEFELIKHFAVGGSGYEIVPFGNQKIFSKIVNKGQSGKGKGKNSFDQAAETSGTGITRENGFNGWIAFDPAPLWRVELGFSRSATFDLNSFAFNLRMNLGRLAHSRRTS